MLLDGFFCWFTFLLFIHHIKQRPDCNTLAGITLKAYQSPLVYSPAGTRRFFTVGTLRRGRQQLPRGRMSTAKNE
jgi:hypothetical protein